MRRARRYALAATAFALIVVTAGCGDSTDVGEGPRIVATTTILGDLARNVVGEAGTVEVLLPIGADPHDYQASSRQVALIQEADLVLANGLGLEEGLEDVLEGAVADGAEVLFLAEYLSPLPFEGDDPEHDQDPHVWLDPKRMADGVELLGTTLADIATGDWEARAESYRNQVLAADGEVSAILAAIPQESRKLVTNHRSLGYFAARYGFTVVGTVVPGGSTLADPSSAELAALVDEIRAQEVPAVFAETTEAAALAAAVAAEAGEDIAVVDLYTGSLGEEGSGAETLIDLWLTNARLIAEALS